MTSTAAQNEVVGKGIAEGYLEESEIRSIVAQGLAQLDVDGRRVLLIVPDGTRTMPMPLLFDIVKAELAGRVTQLDVLIATGTHRAMTDAHLTRHLGRTVTGCRTGQVRIFNHVSTDESSLTILGTIPAGEIAEISGGCMTGPLTVRLNRTILDYDHLLICGPVFPHEVAGFSGGTKYFFPGIAGNGIINLTHWLGALVTSTEIIGVRDTPVRKIIDRAASMVPREHSLIGLVTHHEGVGGIFCGPTVEAWRACADLSAQRHIIWLEQPAKRVLAIMPEMYTDLWTGAKGMYKSEPAVTDGGEVIIFAPHVRDVSHVHGHVIAEIGYHCRDYFLAQWERFRNYPGGILAHSTHVKGKGTYDPATGIETPRIRVTLATGIPEDVCRRINLGYLNPASVDVKQWREHAADGWLVVPRAGEMLYRLRNRTGDTGQCSRH
ncbi:MAG TPA: lactate racemase domain-containing protein [Bryobacteraceae bacterium]